MALRVFTNGSLVSEGMADRLAALRPVAIEMSLHGARAETHDRATGQPGSFEAMLGGLSRLRARHVTVLLKTPLTRLNEGELEGMIALAAARGVPYRVDATLTPRDDGDLSPLAYVASAAGRMEMYRRVAALGLLPVAQHEAGGVNCGLGRMTMAIDPEGNVYPCLQWRKSSLGNVRRTPLRELWHAAPVRKEAAAVSRAASERLVSLGPALSSFPFCPAIALQRTGDPLVPDKDHVAQAEMVDQVRREIA